jgi:hypothetical protein
MSLTKLLVLSAFAIGCVACVGGLDDEELSAEELAVARPCGNFMCGSGNSPEIDHRGLHELNMDGAANGDGFSITSFKVNSTEYTLDVNKAELGARDRVTGALALSGQAVVGGELRVKHTSGIEYRIKIDARGSADYWARPGGVRKSTPTYLVTWLAIGGSGSGAYDWKNICSNPPGDNTDTLGMDRFHVVFFETDRIDAIKKTVTITDPVKDQRWFNIGCATHALSKLHLVGHTEAAQKATAADPQRFLTTPPMRQTYLKAVVGDYCGTGKPFTISGQRLTWKDSQNWMSYAFANPDLEAGWSPNGAICLNTPRLLKNPSPAGNAAYPDIELAIKATCKRPPTCPGSFVANAHIQTAH